MRAAHRSATSTRSTDRNTCRAEPRPWTLGGGHIRAEEARSEEVLHLPVPVPHHPNIAADPDFPGLDTNPQRLVPQPSSLLGSDWREHGTRGAHRLQGDSSLQYPRELAGYD